MRNFYWFTFERGNTDYFIFILLGLFLVFFQKQMLYRAALVLAMAGAMKLYPLLLILLFFADRRYYPAAFCILMMVIFTAGSFLVLHGGGDFCILSSMKTFAKNNGHGLLPRFSTDIFTLLHVGLSYINISINKVKFTHFYIISVLVTLGFLSYYIIFIKQVLWKKLFILISVMMLFPMLSSQYKLMQLFLPLSLYVNSSDLDEKNDVSYLIMYILLFIPINYDFSFTHEFAVSSIVSPIVMLIGSIGIVIEGLSKKRDNRLASF